jgi:O-antigen/teichoic acid export membrane protein
MAIVSLPISTGVAILAPQIIRIIYGHKFDGAVPVLAVLSWTVSAFTISLVFARALVASHNQLWDLWCNTGALIVNIVAGFLLIPRYGPVGAGFAGLISLASFGLFEYLALSNRLFRPVVFAPLVRTLLSCLAMAAALYPIRSLPIVLTIPAGAIVYSIALFVTGSFTPDEITFLRAAITQRLRRNKLALPTHPVIAGESEI